MGLLASSQYPQFRGTSPASELPDSFMGNLMAAATGHGFDRDRSLMTLGE